MVEKHYLVSNLVRFYDFKKDQLEVLDTMNKVKKIQVDFMN